MAEPTPRRGAARAERTRSAIVEAVIALVQAGNVAPSAAQIAAEAGVSNRSVFVHFATLEDLHLAAGERTTELVLELLEPIDPYQPLATRIGELARQRGLVNEQLGSLRRAAALHAATSPALAEARAAGRAASVAQVARVLPELRRLPPAERRRRTASVDAVLSGETWDLLRTVHGLDPNGARRSTDEALRALLEPLSDG